MRHARHIPYPCTRTIDSRKINGRNKNRLFSSPRARRANGEQPRTTLAKMWRDIVRPTAAPVL